MSLKLERELNQNSRNQFNRAKDAANSKNYDYSISLLQSVLKDEPLFLDGRRYLRAVEIRKYRELSSFNRQMLSVKVAPAAVKLSAAGKKEPAEQLTLAEEVLALDPFNAKANALVGDAGTALGHPEFKAFAYETLAEGKPRDKATLNALANAYKELKDWVKAEKTYERILEIDPSDGDALSEMKNVSAAQTSTKWDKAKDYRDMLKSSSEAELLEQQAKVVKSTEAIDEQIRINTEKYQAEPSNPNYAKAIAQYYLQKNDYANSIVWYQTAFDVGGKVDSSLEKTIGDLKLKKVDKELEALNEALSQQTDPEQQAAYANAIEEKKKELDDVRLFQAEARVRAYPNDGLFHFELGEALYKVGQYKRALPELQIGMKQPNVRYQAMNLMGLCFLSQGMSDLAVRRFEDASGELPVMDEMKKEIVYNLGIAYEAVKQKDKALEECWKKIYEVDMGYRDVAERVESSYQQG
ncbi:MAG TPA: tetratricopeptide repeat protein [Candidatus Methylacidiphilales bacterium]|nr:tetratricopeptide repeat protein [Candidatus Methylacidiphilales bacterium]